MRDLPSYDPGSLEAKWQARWAADHTNEPDLDRPRRPFYNLMMFPYPSAEGLHVGNMFAFTGADIYGRFRRLQGHDVFEPIGFDAFGIHSENYALSVGINPAQLIPQNIATFRRQLTRFGGMFDWRHELSTTDPRYYKWTQWIFVQLYKAGIAFRKKAAVNWCPKDMSVVANEQVINGYCERHPDTRVEQRFLEQWFFAITRYAERLLKNLDRLDWSDSTRTLQHNWIGRSEGAELVFETPAGQKITVFTTRPDTVFGATYMVLAPEHPLVDALSADSWPDAAKPAWTGGLDTPRDAVAAYRASTAGRSDLERQAGAAKKKTGVFTGAFAMNPANGAELPIFIADYVLMGYGTGAIMAVPGQDERDWEFAEIFDLPIIRTVQPPEDFDGKAYGGEGPAINSGFLDGKGVADAKAAIVAWLEEYGHGRGAVTYRVRDWLFSRQRYWGEPFPIVYDDTGLPVALPDSMLPLELPETNDFSPKSFAPDDAGSEPEPPLGRLTDWVNVTLDLGDAPKQYRRETSTMPNWAGSCWYELRYLDPTNTEQVVDPEVERYWMGPAADRPAGGVGLYVGGVEHAVLHLLYARFWHKVLFDLGYLSSSEPFHRLINQGYLQLPAYTNANGFYVEAAEVEERDGEFFYRGERVNQEFGKIGKSLKNVITPDRFIADYSTDTFRLFEMFGGPLVQSRPWDAKAIVGPYRLLQRVWRAVIDEESGVPHVSDEPIPDELNRLLHKTIHAVRDGYETLRFNTSIARITELNNAIVAAYPNGGAPRALAEPMVLMLAPLAPHIAEELWSRLGHAESLAWQAFPAADPALLVDEAVDVPVQVNGKVRSVVSVPADADAAAMQAAARADAKIVAALDGREVKRVITVPGRLVNFVV